MSTNANVLSSEFTLDDILSFILDEGGAPLAAPRLTTNQCRAGFALVRVTTNAAPWLTAPSNAVAHLPWTRYGVAEDTFWLPATNWGFVLGTNEVEGLHVSSSGTLSFGWPKGSPRARPMPDGSALSFLAPLQGDLGIAPPQGRFWHAATPSNSLLLTWQDVYAGRETNFPVTFQTELSWNGDFVFRYAYSQPPALTNFAIGAQHNVGGETYALNDTNRLANGLELRWRAFGLLDPGIEDHDGDGLSTYDEVMFVGSDPRRPDSDFDGLADAEELAAGTSPIDPDSDGDGMADGWDAAPLTWSDPDTDVDGDGLDALFESLHGLNPLVRDDIDSDHDGWPDWKELLAGTATNSWYQPGNPDPATELFDATITLHAPLPCPAVLAVGDRLLVLRQPRSYTLTLRAGIGCTNDTSAYTACKNYVLAPPTGEFTNAGEGSYFFLASAEYLEPDSGASSSQLVRPDTDGLSVVSNATTIYLPKAIPSNQAPASITIWKDVAEFTSGGSQYVAFSCQLDTNDATRRTLVFDTWDFPYYQPVENKFTADHKDLFGLGFTGGESIAAEIESAGALVTSGISPSDPVTAKFRGRTIVFRSGGKSTISHEFVHGIGMAHLCGHRDYTATQTCLMHYGHFWLLKPDGTLDRWVRGSPGLKLCPEHVKAIRETNLEDESTSRKLDW